MRSGLLPLLVLSSISIIVPGAAAAVRCQLADADPMSLERWLEAPGEKPPRFEASRMSKQTVPRERADRPIDVLHYDIDLEVSLESLDLSGTVIATLVPLESMESVVLDLGNGDVAQQRVISVQAPLLANGQARPFTHQNDELTISLAQSVGPADTLTIEIMYGGRPPGAALMGYALRRFPDTDGRPDPELPILATLSEPDGARSWWPCHDHPYDAATVELSVTGPEAYTLASAGLRVEDELLGDGRRRQSWSMTSPIPSYLVSLAMSDYERWEETTTVQHLIDPSAGLVEPRQMPIEYYAPRKHGYSEQARHTWQNTIPMLEFFESVAGPYPFADLKYGMALFVFGGAMEHPTMSSMGRTTISLSNDEQTGAPSGEWISAHEMIHQWFGNCVRVERWGEIWLNEGFARYGEVLWIEHRYGRDAGKFWIDSLRRNSFAGPIRDPQQLFGSTVYNKGAWVLHMLRQVMGDEGFLAALKAYVTDPALRFAPVTTEDFQRHCEQVYGESLSWFFGPWLDREGRASLAISGYETRGELLVDVRQPSDRVYRLPLPVRLQYLDGSVEDRIVWVGTRGEQLSRTSLPLAGALASFEVDANRDWLVDVQIDQAIIGEVARLLEPFPNPFNPELNVEFFVSSAQRVRIDIYDIRGRKVRALVDEEFAADAHIRTWDGRDDAGQRVSSGVFFIQMNGAGGFQETRKATLIQ